MMNTSFVQMILDRTPFLRRVALQLTRNTTDAEDLVQDTLLLALRHEDKFAGGTRLEAWLYTILRNGYINQYRKQKRRQGITRELVASRWFGGAGLSNEGLSRLQARFIKEQIEQLPPIYRRPLQLTIAGYRYNEIAEMTGRPLGTVKSQIHFGRTLLRRSLRSLLD